MEEDNACEIANGKPDAKPNIWVNKSLINQNHELLKKTIERAKRNSIYINVIWWKMKYELKNMKKVIIL